MTPNLPVLLVEPAAFAIGWAVLRVPEDVLTRSERAAKAAPIAISAVAAVTAGGSATGWAPLDALLLATLGAAAVLAGSRAPSVLILVAAAACAGAGLDSSALPLALAAIGLMVSSLLDHGDPLIDAAAAGLVASR